MIVGNNTRIDKCKHVYRNHGYIGDVMVQVVSHCVHCGHVEIEVIPRSYQSYCATANAPTRFKYLARLAEEHLEEPKNARVRD